MEFCLMKPRGKVQTNVKLRCKKGYRGKVDGAICHCIVGRFDLIEGKAFLKN